MAGFVRLAPLRCFITLSALAIMYGCAGSSGPSTMPATEVHRLGAMPLSVVPGVKHLFLADSSGNVVTIFGRYGPSRQLTGFNESQLLTTDSAGNLYVVNTGDQNIEVFAPPYRNTPTFTINVRGEFPADVAVAEDGTVAVIGCAGSGSQCGPIGRIVFFANAHAQSPCATVQGKEALAVLLSGAFDAHGSLYIGGLDEIFTTSRLGVVSGECSATKLTVLQANTKIHFAAGVAVDKSGNIATVDSGGFTQGTAVDVFRPPTAGSRQIKLISQNALADSGVVSSFALSKNGSELFTAEPRAGALEYAYPQGGYALGRFTPNYADTVEGVAVTPAEQP